MELEFLGSQVSYGHSVAITNDRCRCRTMAIQHDAQCLCADVQENCKASCKTLRNCPLFSIRYDPEAKQLNSLIHLRSEAVSMNVASCKVPLKCLRVTENLSRSFEPLAAHQWTVSTNWHKTTSLLFHYCMVNKREL